MRDFRDSKVMAQSLRQALTAKAVSISHSESLELVAKTLGLDNWNILAARIEAETKSTAPDTLFCSFCGKSQHDVGKLIAGPKVLICDACVGLCNEVIAQEDLVALVRADQAASPDDGSYPGLTAVLRNCAPGELAAYLSRAETAIARTRHALLLTQVHLGERPAEDLPTSPYPDALEGQPREAIAAQKTKLEAMLSQHLIVLDVVRALLAERD